jgi:uncharacterized membrane protein YdjX (TVP38/TMEM64 family)
VRTTGLRAALLVVLLVAGIALTASVDLPAVATVRSWADGAGGAAWAWLTLGVALLLLGPVPRSALAVLVGVVAGFGPGLVIAFVGAMLGAVIAFGLARSLGRAATTRLAGPRLARVDGLLRDRGFVAVLAGRLLPVAPFVVLSYAAGLTAIRTAPYVLATALALVPSTVVQVGIGASAGAFATWGTAVTVLPGVAVVAVLAWLGVRAWRRRRPAVAV